MDREPAEIEILLAELGRRCHARGWVLGTSGNFSAVLSRDPFCLTVTPSGLDKGSLTPQQFVRVDAAGIVTDRSGRPSAETALHLAVVRERQAGVVLHTHSVWSTIISEERAGQGGLWIEGYEMLKGLEDVSSPNHREWLPILENEQDIPILAGVVETTLKRHPDAHGFLLRKHGLYTWGENLAQANRHLEILEFLLEVVGRTRLSGPLTTCSC
jgi:methylthioribulose-1-phosphate dehydratase